MLTAYTDSLTLMQHCLNDTLYINLTNMKRSDLKLDQIWCDALGKLKGTASKLYICSACKIKSVRIPEHSFFKFAIVCKDVHKRPRGCTGEHELDYRASPIVSKKKVNQ